MLFVLERMWFCGVCICKPTQWVMEYTGGIGAGSIRGCNVQKLGNVCTCKPTTAIILT